MTEAQKLKKSRDPRIGEVIHGKYRIDRKLGEGGMGAVYEGEHTLIGRKVAIKLLRPEIAQEEAILARFQREARAATAIGHDHIVEVTDMGALDDGSAFMVLEYLEGRDLGEELEGGLLSVRQMVHIIEQVCDALSAAHQKGIIHRDLKPGNIFLLERKGDPDFVKVLDFGVAKRHEEEGAEENLTQTGVALGTPAYMAPEQAQNVKGIDYRADIYSVGVIIFECLSGQRPFRGESFVQLMVSVVCDPAPPFAGLRPDLPEALCALVDKLLDKDPSRRFQSCEELRQALLPFADHDDDGRPAVAASTEADDVATLGEPAPSEAELGATVGLSASGADSAATVAAIPERSKGDLQPAPRSAGLATIPQTQASPISAPSIPGVEVERSSFVRGPAGRRGVAVAVAIGIVALVGITAVVIALSGRETESLQPTTGSTVGNVAAVDGPSKARPVVRVQIKTSPPGAKLYLDGEPIANPFDAELPQQNDPRRLEARLAGYQTKNEAISLRYAQTVLIELAPIVALPPADAGPPTTDAEASKVIDERPIEPRRRKGVGLTTKLPVEPPPVKAPPVTPPEKVDQPRPPEPTKQGTRSPLKQITF